MNRPTLQEERKLWRRGYPRVAGLDESGRGPLAGPVLACALLVKKRFQLNNIKDSKKLSEKKREEFYRILTKHPSIEWRIGRVSERVIDKINILEATKLAMKRAVQKLNKKPDFMILDGKMVLNLNIPQKSIIKADEKVFSCACASIIAKVYRDRIMRRYHQQYSQYSFDQHKGYPTKYHRKMLKKHGPCKIHRKSFKLEKSRKLC